MLHVPSRSEVQSWTLNNSHFIHTHTHTHTHLVEQKYVYSHEYAKQFFHTLLCINYCIIFHMNNCKCTFAKPDVCIYICVCVYISDSYSHISTKVEIIGNRSKLRLLIIIMSILYINYCRSCLLYEIST